jgi:hypothetical protein
MTSFRIADDANRRNVKFIHSYDIRRLARSGFLSSSKPPSSTTCEIGIEDEPSGSGGGDVQR